MQRKMAIMTMSGQKTEWITSLCQGC